IDEIKSRMKKLTEQFDLHDFEPQILLCEYRNDANLVGAAANYLAVRQGEN
ncbi:TPA: ROK family protein, partial [Enterococcus faecium]|nr:ROK family protein [Enterococcus faecium]